MSQSRRRNGRTEEWMAHLSLHLTLVSGRGAGSVVHPLGRRQLPGHHEDREGEEAESQGEKRSEEE